MRKMSIFPNRKDRVFRWNHQTIRAARAGAASREALAVTVVVGLLVALLVH